MRVGGPYSVTVAYPGTGGAAFAPETQDNVEVNLGVATDLGVQREANRHHGNGDGHGPVGHGLQLGAHRRGDLGHRVDACVAADRCGPINDFTRLTPQTLGNNSFGGADNRRNNMTVNGAYFNNSFGI